MSSPKALLLCRACAPRADLSSSSSSFSRPSSTLTKSSGRRAALILPTLSFLTTAAPSFATEGANSNNDNNNNNNIVTSYAYFDIGTCESIVRAERALGGDAVCSKADAEMLGRVKVGLYGNSSAKDTVSMFKKLVESGAYNRTVFHDVRKGEFVAFGLNGSKRLGQVSIPDGTFAVGERNADFTKASAFSGKHLKPGVVSLALSYDGSRTASPFDGNVYTEVLITTGPAPVPSLDGKNIIFGQVDRESLDVIAKIANTPVFSPSSQVKAWNFIANRVGDERAAKSKLIWTKPTKAVAIFDSGILEV
jgi:peptidyl-prolyl cis-trans isomerase B (cyclophilin B)